MIATSFARDLLRERQQAFKAFSIDRWQWYSPSSIKHSTHLLILPLVSTPGAVFLSRWALLLHSASTRARERALLLPQPLYWIRRRSFMMAAFADGSMSFGGISGRSASVSHGAAEWVAGRFFMLRSPPPEAEAIAMSASAGPQAKSTHFSGAEVLLVRGTDA
jgi:hypothetical protein